MESLLQNNELFIKLPAFEGPLDLLLFLIRKNEIDIYDIPIESITQQYIAIIRNLEKTDLDLAGDFFVMAATLMYIKSRMLLPQTEQSPENEEEPENDPRWELVQQLLEYKKFKEAARNLSKKIDQQSDYLPRYHPEKESEKPEKILKKSDKITLWNTFNQVLRRLSSRINPGHIYDETVTVADRIEYLLQHLQKKPHFLFSELFAPEKKHSLNFAICTFLAILEMGKQRMIQIQQNQSFDDIHCQALPEKAL